ncbi:hypothetical protein GCM10010170_050990 [Dactylosporangium salmoneum]|uniref:Uncharacterized protein n=1 Tax=Dactylosporangium salmoneum TaxID=53361 RepID=A0ABN3GRG9_9ACTN
MSGPATRGELPLDAVTRRRRSGGSGLVAGGGGAADLLGLLPRQDSHPLEEVEQQALRFAWLVTLAIHALRRRVLIEGARE